jgi:hypothetical protein
MYTTEKFPFRREIPGLIFPFYEVWYILIKFSGFYPTLQEREHVTTISDISSYRIHIARL